MRPRFIVVSSAAALATAWPSGSARALPAGQSRAPRESRIPFEVAAHIAQAIPDARLVTLRDCGHFTYLECASDDRRAFSEFFGRTRAAGRER